LGENSIAILKKEKKKKRGNARALTMTVVGDHWHHPLALFVRIKQFNSQTALSTRS
jgi:hypothetical protein